MAEERGRYLIEFRDIPSERQKIPELTVEERVTDFRQVELGFTQEMAISEAKRCLSCRRCLGCALCLAECHAKAIDFEQVDQDVELIVDSIILAPVAEKIPAPLNEEFGYGKYPNIVTAVEFERILSDNGPYGGLLIRPYDGEIPGKIAFVQCPGHQNADSLLQAVKDISIAQDKVKGLEIHFFAADSTSEGTELEKRLGKAPSVSIRRATAVEIREIEENGNIVISYTEDGSKKRQEEEFDMAVLLTGFDLPPDIKELAVKLGVETKGRYFHETEDISPAETSKSGVFFASYGFIE
jgi:heterodisulfide reductase subunit A-like polyferredoxin